jgi:hypothetical protein
VSVVGAGSATTKLQTSVSGALGFAVVDSGVPDIFVTTGLQGFALSGFYNGVYVSARGGLSIKDVVVNMAKDGFDVAHIKLGAAMDTVTASGCSGAGFYIHTSDASNFTITGGSSTGNLTGVLVAGSTYRFSYSGDTSSNGRNTAGSYDWSLASGATVLDSANAFFSGTINGNGCVGIYHGSTGSVGINPLPGGGTSAISQNGANCSGTGVPVPKTGGVFVASSGPINADTVSFSSNKYYGLFSYLGGKPFVTVKACQFTANYIGVGVQYTTTSTDCPMVQQPGQGISVTGSTFVNNASYNVELQGYVCVPGGNGSTPLIVFTGNTLAESTSIESLGGVNLAIDLTNTVAAAEAVNACNTALDTTTITNPFKATSDSLPLYQIASGEIYCGTP